MEAIVAWNIYFCLQFLELCNCFPVALQSDGAPPGLELGALAPSLLAALSIVTVILLLVGCSWCRRIVKKDAHSNHPMQLGVPGAVQMVDTGIQNPLNDIRLPITAALNHSPQPQHEAFPNPIISPPFYQQQPEIENNNGFEDNNNGPISVQELENIVNNNAENYIVSEYENRNLNQDMNRQREREIIEEPQISRHLSPSHSAAIHQVTVPDVWEDCKDWFENPENNFPRNQLQYLQVIGRGWFGRIVEGEAHNLSDSVNANNKLDTTYYNPVTKVAVKILDENVSTPEKCIFLNESRIYRDMNHENLLKFLGQNLTQDPWFVFFEYCPMGDLKQFLLSNKSQMTALSQKGIPLKFQCEISSALNYLHQNNIIHQDIACHSCLIAEGPRACLGDYGDAERRYPEDYYSVQGKKPSPIRWLPPESILHSQVTTASNMWSFGILLWESCSWGDRPYENITNEQYIQNIINADSFRLLQPVPNTEYVTYLYTVMQSCWQIDPIQRCESSQVAEYLQNIYSNFHQVSSHSEESITHNFDARWHALKPNTIPKIDNDVPYSNVLYNEDASYYNHLKFPSDDIIMERDISNKQNDSEYAYHNLAISSDTLTSDELSIKVKSDSLNNLHGSFESVQEFSSTSNIVQEKSLVFNNGSSTQPSKLNVFWEQRELSSNSPLVHNEECTENILFEKEVSFVAPWLRDVPFKTPEDISYIKNVSDVISDFDNMLSSEKTSSSESSHQTSPSREIIINSREIVPEIPLNISKTETHMNENLSGTITTANFHSTKTTCITNINSDIVCNSLHNVPEISKQDKEELYPTLDFRLNNLQENIIENAANSIFTIKSLDYSQESDSLQDSSYIPDNLKNEQTEKHSNEESRKVRRQCSSGSETDDEIWKKRIELGTLTEKIKMKSKSVTDFMVLTHIDMDFTDLESEDTPYTSLEGKSNLFFDLIQKKFRNDSPHKETSLPSEEYSSFPRNFSTSLLSGVESLKPGLDLYKLWKNHRILAIKSLRPSKSLTNLDSVTKCPSIQELKLFRKNIDSFLDSNVLNNSNMKNSLSVKLKGDKEESDPNTSIKSEKCNFSLSNHYNLPQINDPNDSELNDVEQSDVRMTFKDQLIVPSEEEDLKFSSNFNDINLCIYSGEQKSQVNNVTNSYVHDLWDSTKYVNLPESFTFHGDLTSYTSLDKQPLNIELYDSQYLNKENKLKDDGKHIKSDLPKLNIESSNIDNFENNEISTSTPIQRNILENIKSEIQKSNSSNSGMLVNDTIPIISVEQQIKEIMHNEIMDLTTKLAIAENENNLNIEHSSSPEVVDHVEYIFANDSRIDTNSLDRGSDEPMGNINELEPHIHIFEPILSSQVIDDCNISDSLDNVEISQNFQHRHNYDDVSHVKQIDVDLSKTNQSISEICINDVERGSDKISSNDSAGFNIIVPLNMDSENESNPIKIDSERNNESIEIKINQITTSEPLKSITDPAGNVAEHVCDIPETKIFESTEAESCIDSNILSEFVANELSHDNLDAVDACEDQSKISNVLINHLDIELEKLDFDRDQVEIGYSPETSESLYENVEPRHNKKHDKSGGWFLHPKSDNSNDAIKITNIDLVEIIENPHKLGTSTGSSTESLTENSCSDRYVVDAESVQALRDELELKLPLAQRIGQICHDNLSENIEDSKNWQSDTEPTIGMCKPSLECTNIDDSIPTDYNQPSTSSDMNSNISKTSTQSHDAKSFNNAGRNEVLIHYNMYGIVPLSPIQEESWSEFSEMEKAADLDKTDTSHSLSLGEQTSNIESVLPFDGICQAVNSQVVHQHNENQSQQKWSDDDTYSDCSNRTFVLNDCGPLNRQQSLSADSLNSFEEQIDLEDDDNEHAEKRKTHSEIPIINHHVSELLSPFYEDHSHTKSTEEISQNVDNLLENISKTLENASKIGSLSSEGNETVNLEVPKDDLSQNISEISENDNSGSRTYVIEDQKPTLKDLSLLYNNKVAELTDDLSNVSKISQPSFISELTSPDGSDVKPSEKSMSTNLHTKTPSIDSWCSNDTLFNVEENFDDFVTSPINKESFHQSPTMFENNVNLHWKPSENLHYGQTSYLINAPVEMVRGSSENIMNTSVNTEEPYFCPNFHETLKSPPDNALLNMNLEKKSFETFVENSNINLLNNKSDDSLTVESDISIVLKSNEKVSSPLDDVLKDSPIPAIDTSNLNLPKLTDESSGSSLNETRFSIETDPSLNDVITVQPVDLSENLKQSVEQLSGTENGNIISPSTISNSMYATTFESLQTNVTSTPTNVCNQMKVENNTEDNVECTDNLIDDQFKFLEYLVDPSISSIDFKDDNYKSIINSTHSFLDSEQKFANSLSQVTLDSNIQYSIPSINIIDVDDSSLVDISNAIDKNTYGDIGNDSTSVCNSHQPLEITQNDDMVMDDAHHNEIIEHLESPKTIGNESTSLDSFMMNVHQVPQQISSDDNGEKLNNSSSDNSDNKTNDKLLYNTSELSDINHPSTVENDVDVDNLPSLKSFIENIANVPQDIHTEKGQNNFSKQENITDLPSSLYGIEGQYSSAIDEYVECTGLNMGAHNLNDQSDNVKDSPSFEVFKESIEDMPQDLNVLNYEDINETPDAVICSPGLSDIHFSGPSNDEMSPSYEVSPCEKSATVDIRDKLLNDINHMAPERLKEWDTESDDSNCSSTCSGDFVWKEGDDGLLTVPDQTYHLSHLVQKNHLSRGVSTSFTDIPEEDPVLLDQAECAEEGDGDEDDEDEEVEFVPSSWDYLATPTKSSLKSPETSQMENRKRVVFKKQKYQCIYEYPREVMIHDEDEFQTLPDYSTYAEWHPFGSGNGSYMAMDFENFINSHPGDLQQSSIDPTIEDDFYISSSTRPFETCSVLNSSSQFFPGQQYSLLNNLNCYENEVSDVGPYDILPTVMKEYEDHSPQSNENLVIEDVGNETKPTLDYVTPDSGTEDITPGSLIDFDIHRKLSNEMQECKKNDQDSTYFQIVDNANEISHGLTDEELVLNANNQIKNECFTKPFCGALILPDGNWPNGSLTPSTQSPSPSASGHSSQSSGSTSPLPRASNLLGGLRHTRDKLKLDLPPSPLARNSPCLINSGKNANKEVKIFDFKNIDFLQTEDLDQTVSESISDVSSSTTQVEHKGLKKDEITSLETPVKFGEESPEVLHNDVNTMRSTDRESVNTDNLISKEINDIRNVSQNDKNNIAKSPDFSDDVGSFEAITIQKAVIPLHDDDNLKRVSLEPVKGEGTLLDSGDEDSGIGSSAYATLERKLDSREIDPEPTNNLIERKVN